MAEADNQDTSSNLNDSREIQDITPKPPAADVTLSQPNTQPVLFKAAARYLPFILATVAVLLFAVIALAAQLVNVRSHNRSLQAQLSAVESNPQALVQKQTDDLIVKVGSLMSLPTGETPTVVAVTDAPTAAKQSAFFANAINGDKVLMYVKAGEAILYRPSNNKIILVGPLKLNDTQSSTSQQ